MKSIWFFDDVNLFSLLCPHKFKEYKSSHTFNHYQKDDYVYFEEDASQKVYLIEKGKVKIGYYAQNGSEIISSILTRGELFGEKAILGEETRNEFAKSLDNNTSICPIGVDVMHDLMRDNKTFSLKIYKLLGWRIKKLERRLQSLLFKDTRTRFLEFLSEMNEEFGEFNPNLNAYIITHPYTQKDIACLIGASRPTFNIILNELKEEGVLSFNRKEIIWYKK